ncbi:hypothetical protein C3747_89g148 [Trypanosoma cruzi]|uniref:Uncharacterized protein n=2 Tax=Trypanosoma cruzi TaxID=5693 RepID=Q4DG18_TRYCC|nr:hypothetical protein, conserved [Trypanosoma cruzi]EAN91455.1 hypothetical protein, conserved [Trypanosoma cruzi]PWV08497.1 hypothetical protein C3747_89g148 [Trypanosoma cruzi]RNC49426.1 hypothetical protein TcCL_NonESM00653 [Trypanosoma cruzi]|eukprot:XP_813306.1 hypothetical protein [Trypanosoma cruzi strain CL Brener]
MLHASRLAWGPFVLNTRVIPDWWQSFQREDQHRVARARATQLRTPRDESRQNDVTPITLREADELVKTYTRNHNAEDLSWIVQYIRETMGEPLNLLYYHSLFRVFNYTRDKENIEQLLHVITESGEADMGTYALVVDALHCLSPVDTLARIMRMIAVTQTSFGTLLSESGCPLLTSLLHHLANTGKYPSTASLLVVLWIRALGAQLCDWDYVHVLSALLSHPDDFPQIRSALGAFSDFSRGTVSPEALFRRLEDRGELSPPSSPLNTIVAAMRVSLSQAGVNLEEPVSNCVINTRTAGLPSMVEHIVNDMTSVATSGKFNGDLLSCYHVLALLYSTLRNDTAAVETLRYVAREIRRRERSVEYDGGNAALAPIGEYVHHHYLMDIGSVLNRVSMRTLQRARADYAHLAQNASSDVSENDVVAAESYAILFVRSNEEAEEALRQASQSVDLSSQRTRLSTKLLFRRFVELCARHPKRNCKLTPVGLEERRKWGRYLDARDTSLALFGSAKQARDSMKHLFYNDNKLPELRSHAMIERDMNDTAALFKWRRAPTIASLRVRSSLPHVRCPADPVPRHLWDPDVYNPYPQLMLQMSPMDDERVTEDIFQELWHVLMNPSVVGTDQWYLRDTEMYLLLLRCLIHRLDWEAAVHLTLKTMENLTYTYMMDHEVTLMFKEIGDPAGCLAFKVATKLFDGRIIKDGQSKREKFHQEQFGEV